MIQNSIDSKRTPLLKGEVGLILSTIEVLKIAIKNNYKRILLLDLSIARKFGPLAHPNSKTELRLYLSNNSL